MFVYKFSVQGNLYLARYKQLKFRLQGKFCGKIITTNGSNCNIIYCGLRKHSLRYANLTVCDLKFRLQNYHKSHTLCLVCLIHASLNGISQVTFLLLHTIVFRQYRQTEMSLFVRRWSNVSFVTLHWNTSHCLELSNTTSSHWSSKSQSCPLQNTTSVRKYLWKLHFIIKSHSSFSISWNSSKVYNASQINLSALHSTTSVAKERCHCLCWCFWLVSQENRLSL